MNHFLPKCDHIPCIQCLNYIKGLCRPQLRSGAGFEEAAWEEGSCVLIPTAPQNRGAASRAKQEGDGAGVQRGFSQDSVVLLPWEAAALEEDFHSPWLTNGIEIYLPAVTK